MRAVVAGLFVFAGMIVGLGLIDKFWGDHSPVWAMVVFVGLYLPVVFAAAYVLFNRGVPRPWSPTAADVTRKLEEQGLLTAETYHAVRAFQVDDLEGDGFGLSYFLELQDGGVLFLLGSYLQDYMPWGQARAFPCTEFTLRRHKHQGHIVDLVPAGTALEPELIATPLDDVVFRDSTSPEDGQIIRDRTYNELKAAALRALLK